MIARLTGQIVSRSPDGVVIDVGGVGYEVSVPLCVLATLPDDGRATTLEVVTLTREDGVHLFGFATQQEKLAFRQLLTVGGVGPKIALSVLSGMRVGELAEAVAARDWRRLASVQGIGRKTAERIIFDLKDVFDVSGTAAPVPLSDKAAMFEDLRGALIGLGYKPAHVDKVVQQMRQTATATALEDLLKEALRVIRG
jgi:Holliday junction DNA helicase RuvA